MTRKEQIRRTLEKQPDDVTFDQMIYLLSLMKNIEIGVEQADRGDVMDHDEFFEQLLNEDANETSRLEQPRANGPSGNSGIHRKRRPKGGDTIHQTAEEVADLKRFPEIGGRLEDIDAPPNILEIFYGDYRIVYRFDGRIVVILTVFHGSKRLDPRILTE